MSRRVSRDGLCTPGAGPGPPLSCPTPGPEAGLRSDRHLPQLILTQDKTGKKVMRGVPSRRTVRTQGLSTEIKWRIRTRPLRLLSPDLFAAPLPAHTDTLVSGSSGWDPARTRL